MIQWFINLFRIPESNTISSKLYSEVLDLTRETKGLIEATLEAMSEEQVSYQQEIDALVHEITLKKLAIVDGANKALHVQKLRDLLDAGVGELREAVEDAVDAVEDLVDGIRS